MQKSFRKTLTIEVESLEETRIKEQAMTIAEMLEERGAKKATEKTRKETTEKYVLGMLAEGVSMDIIVKIAGLSEAEVHTIESLKGPA